MCTTKDLICPLALASSFPDDTLFFIFEQDFELFPEGVLPTANTESASASTVQEPRPVQGTKRKASGDATTGADDHHYASDLVKMVNEACRRGVGDMVWLGYQPRRHPRKKQDWQAKVAFGSTLICINRTAAENIGRLMGYGFPGWNAHHIDRWILNWCQDHRFSHGRASYVFPPIGSYGTHLSSCCPDTGVRESWWQESFAFKGTRATDDSSTRTRDLYAFCEEGKGLNWIFTFRDAWLCGDLGIWKSFLKLDDDRAATTDFEKRRRRSEMMRVHKLRINVKTEREALILKSILHVLLFPRNPL